MSSSPAITTGRAQLVEGGDELAGGAAIPGSETRRVHTNACFNPGSAVRRIAHLVVAASARAGTHPRPDGLETLLEESLHLQQPTRSQAARQQGDRADDPRV
jgi:hypothetical protein